MKKLSDTPIYGAICTALCFIAALALQRAGDEGADIVYYAGYTIGAVTFAYISYEILFKK